MDGRTGGHAVHPPNDDAAKGSVSAFRDIRHNEPSRTRVIRRESNRTRTIAKLRDEMRQIPSQMDSEQDPDRCLMRHSKSTHLFQNPIDQKTARSVVKSTGHGIDLQQDLQRTVRRTQRSQKV